MNDKTTPPPRPRCAPLLALTGCALVLAAALGGCSGCSESAVNPETPEDAARIWGKLLCDMRESRVTLYINDFDNQHGTAIVRAQLLAGDSDGKPRARFLGQLNDFIEENGHDIVACTSEIHDKRTLDNGRVQVDLSVEYKEIGTNADADLKLVDLRHDLTLEVTKIDDAWRISGEPVDAPTLDDFVLLHRPSGPAMP